MIDNDLIINITSGEICWFYIFQNKSLGTDLGVGRDRSWSQRDRESAGPGLIDLLWNLVGGGGKMEGW